MFSAKVNLKRSLILPEVLIIKPSVSHDLRGNIYTSYEFNQYKDILPKGCVFNHDKFAESKKNVLRGLHGDTKTWKLVSCVFGKIYQVVVDWRNESPKFKKWDAFVLNSESYQQILIPPNFLNGYYVLSNVAVFHYKLAYPGCYIDANDQITVSWCSKDISIEWPSYNPILQERDK